MINLIIYDPTHDNDYYIAKRNELQARLDEEVLRSDDQLKYVRTHAK